MTQKKKQAAQKKDGKSLSGINLKASPKLKESAITVLKEAVIGAAAGAATGAVVGRGSLVIGALISGIGHYNGNASVSMFGMGMMASGGYQIGQGLRGTEPAQPMDGVKERLSAFKEGFMKQLWLDKLVKRKTKKDESVNGTENVQYFSYPENNDSVGELDMSGLDSIEEELQARTGAFSGEAADTGNEPIY